LKGLLRNPFKIFIGSDLSAKRCKTTYRDALGKTDQFSARLASTSLSQSDRWLSEVEALL